MELTAEEFPIPNEQNGFFPVGIPELQFLR